MGASPKDFEYAPGWVPEPGSIAQGVVTSITRRSNEYHPPPGYPIVTIRLDEPATTHNGTVNAGDELAVHVQHAMLEDQLRDLRVQPGDEIVIWYGGQKDSVDGKRRYHNFRARRLDGAPITFDWGGTPEPPASDVPSEFPAYGEPPVQAGTGAPDDDIPFAPSAI